MNFTQWYLMIDNELKSIEQIVHSIEHLVYNKREEMLETYPNFEKIQENKQYPPFSSNSPAELSLHESVKYHLSKRRFFRLKFTYPKIIWPSLFTSMFSFLEHVLHQLCTTINDGRPNYGRHSMLDRYRLFLKKKDIDFPDQEPEWAKIKFYKRLRDLVVHNRSHIETFRNKEKLYNQIEDEFYLEIKNGYVVFSPEFIKETLITYDKFYKKLFYD